MVEDREMAKGRGRRHGGGQGGSEVNRRVVGVGG
jgi:hypothetical protein